MDWSTEASKYHPLFEHLLFSGQGHLSMTFAEIEAIMGARLPKSARQHDEWWSNNPRGHSQARAWMRATYRTSRVNLARETVAFTLEGWPDSFQRVGLPRPPTQQDVSGFAEANQSSYEHPSGKLDDATASEAEHPLFGIWIGKVTLKPDYDYASPAFEPDPSS